MTTDSTVFVAPAPPPTPKPPPRWATWLAAVLYALSWRLRVVRRVECWLRKSHRGFWGHGLWVCRRCAKVLPGKAPTGAFLTDEQAAHVYQVGARGELRRVDKVKGGKKYRRRHKAEVERAERIRAAMLGERESA